MRQAEERSGVTHAQTLVARKLERGVSQRLLRPIVLANGTPAGCTSPTHD